MPAPNDQAVDQVDPVASKAELRRAMRAARRSLEDRAARSAVLFEHVSALEPVRRAERLLVFSTIVGEPETAPFVDACRVRGQAVAMPEEEVAPDWPDIVVVPGLAFTAAGDRLGQGGGWYDRFLAQVRPECVLMGVGFAPQLVDALPVEPHDVRLDYVVTDAGVIRVESR